jgi:hypothetical protein
VSGGEHSPCPDLRLVPQHDASSIVSPKPTVLLRLTNEDFSPWILNERRFLHASRNDDCRAPFTIEQI